MAKIGEADFRHPKGRSAGLAGDQATIAAVHDRGPAAHEANDGVAHARGLPGRVVDPHRTYQVFGDLTVAGARASSVDRPQAEAHAPQPGVAERKTSHLDFRPKTAAESKQCVGTDRHVRVDRHHRRDGFARRQWRGRPELVITCERPQQNVRSAGRLSPGDLPSQGSWFEVEPGGDGTGSREKDGLRIEVRPPEDRLLGEDARWIGRETPAPSRGRRPSGSPQPRRRPPYAWNYSQTDSRDCASGIPSQAQPR